MAEVVVVQDPDGSGQNVAQGGHLERLHPRVRHEQTELLFENAHFEQRAASNDLQSDRNENRK